jgi:hypothetical protein
MSTPGGDLPSTPWPTAPPGAPGLKAGFPEVAHYLPPERRLSHRVIVGLVLAGLAVLTVVLLVVVKVATPGPAKPCPPLSCQGPPVNHPGNGTANQSAAGPAEETGTLYTSPTGFSLRYPPAPVVFRASTGVVLSYDFKASGVSRVLVAGGPVTSITPETAVNDFIRHDWPNAQLAYQVPDMLIGYQPAYGVAINVESTDSFGSTTTDRLFVAAAVRNGFLIEVAVEGPLLAKVTSTSPYWNGHPSPADSPMAYNGADAIVNSVLFP